MTFDEYSRIEAVNWSTLKELRRSALHYQHRLTTPQPDTAALALGRAVHCAVFEPDELPLRYVVYTESKTKGEGARKAWEAFKEANAARTILSADDWRTVCAIRDSVRRNQIAQHYLKTGLAESVCTWTDWRTGLPCKARLDWITSRAIVDLKTARDISPRRFGAQAAALGYHGQLAFYAEAVKAKTGLDAECVILAVESEAPHDVIIYRPDNDWLDEGDAMVRELLDELAARRMSGSWPGQALGQELSLSLPPWALPDDEAAAGLGITFVEDEVSR